MQKEELIDLLSKNIKLIRLENDFTQDEMSEIIGLSKKSLIEIEKGRKKLNWSVAVAICAIFNKSKVMNLVLDEKPVDLVSLIALREREK
ncbi:helix-turn-helix domain-containing protein [Clostridiaceae bacterium M8S5]|nr:helix-turn-helix domain-containing protein [Clostridiaceae bacterium M8S5]